MSVFASYLGGQKARAEDVLSQYSAEPRAASPLQGYGQDFTTLQDAFARVESDGSGGYLAVGPETGNGRAYGRYQVMDFNIGPWTEEVLGRRMSVDEFLNSPEAQDAVFNAKMQEYTGRYGTVEDAASMWFSGRPFEGNTRSDGYLTVPEYVSKVMEGL